MKHSETCPKCRSTKLFVVPEVQRRHETEAAVGAIPMTVTSAQVRVGDGFFGEGETRNVEAGRFEAWVCAGCGYTEWYATRLEELAVLAGASTGVRFIDRAAEGGPYRR
jgi:predicted nucleic-acid-binding Zn-ribbon protein